MQVDWISAIVETPPELAPGYRSGMFLRLGPGGEIESEKPSPLDVKDDDASSSRAFRVWTPRPQSLYLSGNPVKLLQGHNLFGSCDVPGLYLEAGVFVRQHSGLFPSPETWHSCQFGLPRFTRLDITRSYRFESVSAAQSYIRHVAGASRSRHGAAKLYGSETAIFGEGSRRWSFKIYDKHSEMRHQLRKSFRGRLLRRVFPGMFDEELMHWSAGVVRFELTLRSLELEELQPLLVMRPGQERGGTWPALALSIWQRYFDRLTLNENATMSRKADLIEQTLNGSQRACLHAWRTGADLRAIYPRNTFYRHRRALLDRVGVDIASPPPADADDAEQSAGLDPAGWDPAPIEARQVEPRESLKAAYKLL